MQWQKIDDVNAFIAGVKDQDEADFYTEICDYFDFKKLGDIFSLPELIETFRDIYEVFKNHGSNINRTGVFIKNILETRNYNKVQKYNVYLLLHIFFDYVVFNTVAVNREKYLNWISDQLDLVNEAATLYYYDFNFAELSKKLIDRPVDEQIRILLGQKKEYLLAIEKHQIPANNFDKVCDLQIDHLNKEGTKESYKLQNQDTSSTPVKVEEVPEKESEKKKSLLVLPQLEKDYGDVYYAADYTGYSVSTIRRLAQTQKIPAHKPTQTGEWRFYAMELDDWKSNGMKNFLNKSDEELLMQRNQHKRK